MDDNIWKPKIIWWIGENGVAVIGVGSRDAPFKYGYRVIEPDVFSKNRRAQLVANNKAGFFKIGFVLPFAPETNSIIVGFLRGTESMPPIEKLGRLIFGNTKRLENCRLRVIRLSLLLKLLCSVCPIL